jgi:hypothetical protein
LSACFAHSRGSTACAFAIAGETCSKSCTARHLAASVGLRQISSYSAATIRRTVSTTMSRARSSDPGSIRCAGKAGDERHEKLVAHPVHHEIVEVNCIFGHRTGKAVRKAPDIRDLPVLETRRQSRRPRLRRYFRPCSAACAIRAPGENWRAAENRAASTAPRLDGTDRLASIRHQSECPADISGTHAGGRRKGRGGGIP